MNDAVVAALAHRLDATANERTRDWWERYLKGAVPFRGVAMAGVRRALHETWEEEGPAELPVRDQIELALQLFRGPYAEDKLVGVLALAERLLPELTVADVPRLARPFAEGSIDDWSTCDWYCVKVLGPLVEHSSDRRAAAEAIAAWRSSEPLWQRRAAAVAFVDLAPTGDAFYDGFVDLLLAVCAANVRDPARFSQTSVGWLLRELSQAARERVAAFVELHHDQMSAEARRAALAKLGREAGRKT